MKSLSICMLFVMALVEYGHSETIQCYTCDNCNKLDDTLLTSCPPDTTTSASTTDNPTTPGPTSTAPSETTLPPIEITDEPTESPEGNSQESVALSAPLAEEAQFHSVLRRSLQDLTYKSLMLRRATRETVSYYCYSIERDDGDKKTTKKGCVEVPGSKKACEVLTEQYGVTGEKCKACNENKCNSSGVLRYSLVIYMAVIFLCSFHV